MAYEYQGFARGGGDAMRARYWSNRHRSDSFLTPQSILSAIKLALREVPAHEAVGVIDGPDGNPLYFVDRGNVFHIPPDLRRGEH